MPLDTSIALGVQNPQIQSLNPAAMMDMQAQMEQRRSVAGLNALRGQLLQQEMSKNALAMQGQGLTNEKTSAEIKGVLSENQKKAVEARAAKIGEYGDAVMRASTPEEVSALIDSHAMTLKELGIPPEQAKKNFFDLAAKSGFENAQMMSAKGAITTQKHFSDMASAKAAQTQLTTTPSGDYVAINKATATGMPVLMGANPSALAATPAAAPTTAPIAGATAPSLPPTTGLPAELTPGMPVKGTPTQIQLNMKKQEEGKKAIDETLSAMSGEYEKLAANGSMPSETGNMFSNAPARFAASPIGRTIGYDPKAQSSYQRLDGLRRDLITAIKNATGMSAQELNSNVELQQMLAATTAPGQNVEAVRSRLNDISKRYGLGKDFGGGGSNTAAASAATVVTPDGKTHTFPTAEAAAQFKKAAGIP
jgi:hypothetical protein